MRVGIYTRRDSNIIPGGDNVQIRLTTEFLKELGCEIVLLEHGDTPPHNVDLVHVFNVQRPMETMESIRKARVAAVPVVLSPIFWDTGYKSRSLVRGIAREVVRQTGSGLVAGLAGVSRQRKHWLAARWCLSEVDMCLPNSIAELESLVHVYRCESLRGKSRVIYNGVAPEWYGVEDFGESQDKCGVLCVGRIEAAKGQLQLITAFKQSSLPSLTLVGSFHDQKYVDECRRLAGADKRIKLIPHVKQAELKGLYDKSKVHVLLSERESPGLVSLEAFARQCNLVVTDHGPVNEYFCENTSIVDREDIGAIVIALEKQHESTFQSSDWYKHASTTFNWQSIAKETLKCYQSVVK